MEDRQFTTVFIAVFAGLIAFAVIILFVANSLTSGGKDKFTEDPTMMSEVADRIAPIGQVNVGEVPVMKTSASSAASSETPEQTYKRVCAACHDAGVLNAPKHGDSAAWTERKSKGMETLYMHAINGFNTMPAKGGAADLTDDQVKAVVDYIVK